MAPTVEAKGVCTFHIAQKEASVAGARRSVGDSSLSVIAPTTVRGRVKDSEDARRRLKDF